MPREGNGTQCIGPVDFGVKRREMLRFMQLPWLGVILSALRFINCGRFCIISGVLRCYVILGRRVVGSLPFLRLREYCRGSGASRGADPCDWLRVGRSACRGDVGDSAVK